MLRNLNNLTFRFIILASLGAPALLLWISGYYAWESWHSYNILRTTIRANTVADNIISAAGLQALERGITTSLLSAAGPANEAARQRLKELRNKSDKLWQEAGSIAAELEAKEVVYQGTMVAQNQANDAYRKLVDARKRVDASLLKAERDIKPNEWLSAITGFINYAARLRIASFGGNAFPPEITYPNLTTKHSVWLAAEYAGLERATFAAIINSNAPATADALQKLGAYRQIVEANIADIRFVRDIPGTDAQVVSAIDAMEKHFLGEYEGTRKRLYAEAEGRPAAEGRQYGLTSAEWIEKSTAAIDTILNVSDAFTKVGNAQSESNAQVKFVQTMGYMGLFVAMTAVSALAIFLWFNKLRHLDRLRDSMVGLASGQGDLTLRLGADTRDEIGQTSAAFNRFAGNLQGIIVEVRSVILQLADAAEKLTTASQSLSASSRTQSEMSLATASAVEQVTASIGHVAERAGETLDDSRKARALAEEGVCSVRQVADEIRALAAAVTESSRHVEGLGERSREISGIVQVIREIADQTNLLALNAAIEAARAGEQGRGFAVVADEVRKLAERTGAATLDISRMIDSIRNDTEAAVEGMHASTASVEEGVALTSKAADALVQISASTHHAEQRVALLRQASHDPLTGALTRRSGVEILDLYFRLACDQDAPLSVLFIDADSFKSINDQFGHEAGDQALKNIAAQLQVLLRQADALIRWGGEEFVVILTNTPISGAGIVVGRIIHDGLGKRPDGNTLTASMGLAERQIDGATDWPQLIALADERMYVAKTSGKACCVTNVVTISASTCFRGITSRDRRSSPGGA
ncbi:MAG: methyl-accepting chemotaxis protein [Rhodocyclaceae bacterium]|nr:methyl-accepting chemotaxis protein [Rhodocyclaceae bacterium]